MSLREKTVNAIFWSFTDNFVNLGGQFVVGILLARLLTPREFGLVSMLAIFIAISQSLIDSGFSNALIRKKDCTQADYSTVFYFNLIIGIGCYLILFLLSGKISQFFHEPQLKLLIRILGISLIVNSFSIIQRTILIKNINFKTQTKISLIATAGSSTIAIAMALNNYGVWSLVALTLSRFSLLSVFLWIWSKWKPAMLFCKKSFDELFSFGSKLLLSGLLETVYQNVYYIIVGKFFSATELGYYSRADQFQSLPSGNLQSVISRVSYPVMSSIQDDPIKLKEAFRRIIKNTMFLTFILMIGLVAISKPMITALLGSNWEPSVIYLQLLCFVGMFYPLHAINLNMLQVKGRSDMYLKLEILKKILAVPVILCGIYFGIKIMIFGMMIHSLISLYLNSYWSGRLIGYPITDQIKNILPSLLLAFGMGAFVYIESLIFPYPSLLLLLIQILSGVILIMSIGEILNIKEYLEIKTILKSYLSKLL